MNATEMSIIAFPTPFQLTNINIYSGRVTFVCFIIVGGRKKKLAIKTKHPNDSQSENAKPQKKRTMHAKRHNTNDTK